MYLFRGDAPLQEFAARHAAADRLGMQARRQAASSRATRIEEAFFLPNARQFRAALKMPLILLGGITDRADHGHRDGRGLRVRRDGPRPAARARPRQPDRRRTPRRQSLCIHCNKCMPTIYTRHPLRPVHRAGLGECACVTRRSPTCCSHGWATTGRACAAASGRGPGRGRPGERGRARRSRGELRRDGPFHVGVLLENVPEFVFWLGGAALAGATVVGINPTRARRRAGAGHPPHRLPADRHRREPALKLLDGARPRRPPRPCPLGRRSRDYAARLAAHAVRAGQPDASVTPDDAVPAAVHVGDRPARRRRCAARRAGSPRIGRSGSASSRARDDVCYCADAAVPRQRADGRLCAPALAAGATIALRRKFSASGFLPDVRRLRRHVLQLRRQARSRYILATPERPDDADNPLQHGFGTEASPRGHRPVPARFGVPRHRRLRLERERGIDHAGAGTRRRARSACPADGIDVAVLDPETGEECPRARFDDDGRLLNADEAIGEIVSRDGAGRFEGYYNNPRPTPSACATAGTGRATSATATSDGFFYFAGRTADWIRVDGENFAAAPGRAHPRPPPRGRWRRGVRACPTRAAGDQVMAAIELRPTASTFDPARSPRSSPSSPTSAPSGRRVSSASRTRCRRPGPESSGRRRCSSKAGAPPTPSTGGPGGALPEYTPMTDADKAALREEFAAAGRLRSSPDPFLPPTRKGHPWICVSPRRIAGCARN